MLKSRVSGIPDTGRLAEAVSRPGIDPREWVSLAYVEKFFMDPVEGPFVDVVLMPSEQTETARVGSEYAGPGFGIYFPLEKDDEVLVGFPNGDPDEGLVVIRKLWSCSDPPPQDAIDNPADVVLHVKDGANVHIVVGEGGTINLGESTLQAIDGVVTGQAIDSFTGATFFALGNASDVVKAKK